MICFDGHNRSSLIETGFLGMFCESIMSANRSG